MRQRCPTAHGNTQAPAKLRLKLACHQALEQRPHQPVQRGPDTALAFGQRQVLQPAKAPPAHRLRRFKQTGPEARARQRLMQSGKHTLVNARHRNQHRRPHGFQVFGQQRDRARVGHATAHRHRQVITGRALKGVRQRQEGKEHVVCRGHDALQNRLYVGHDVAVRQHHALGLAGGARGVNDGRQIVPGRCQHSSRRALARRQPAGQRIDRHGFAGGWDRVYLVGDHNAPQRGQCQAQAFNRAPLRERRHHQHARLAVRQDVGNAAGVVDGMQRHRHKTLCQRRLVQADRIQAVGQQDGDACMVRQLHGGQRLTPLRDALAESGPARADPLARAGVEFTVSLALRGLRDAKGQQFRQGANIGKFHGVGHLKVPATSRVGKFLNPRGAG